MAEFDHFVEDFFLVVGVFEADFFDEGNVEDVFGLFFHHLGGHVEGVAGDVYAGELLSLVGVGL